jgi:hypothetical protein
MDDLVGAFRADLPSIWPPNFIRKNALFFLKDRILIAKIGNCLEYTSFHYEANTEKLDKMMEQLVNISNKELLKENKANFEILYQDIRKIEMNNYIPLGFAEPRAGILILYTRRKLKFDIPLSQNFSNCRKIVNLALSDKLSPSI